MKIKLQCCRCGQAEEGEQLYKIDGQLYCSICGMDKCHELGLVEFDGFADEIVDTEDEE